MKFKREKDWPSRLHAELARQRALPFAWGASDCTTMIADCVLAMTGTDPLPKRYWKSRRGAHAAMERRGGLAAALGRIFDPCPVAMARRGDIGVLEHGGRFVSPVICDGTMFVGKSEGGTIRVPRDQLAAVAYRVG